MALSGSFQQLPVSHFGLYCTWSASQSASGNYSDVTLNVYIQYWSLDVGARSDSTIEINGVKETYTAQAISHNAGKVTQQLIKSKTVRVYHNADGTKTGVTLSASWRMSGTYSGVSVGTITASTTIDLNTITTYTLSLSAGTGSNITVNRTSSGYGSTGNLSNGARLYYNDKLKITFTPSTNYAISTHTVNGSTFSSGNTHTVTGNVTVKATAQVLASSVGATNANIGSTSTITVTKYNSSYYHSLKYTFGSLSGYITSSGGTQSSETKFSGTSVAFKIPTSFYAQIPNNKTGTCTITCYTYSSASSTTVLGSATQCTITVTATGSPTVSGSVVDTNTTTVALTGDSSKLIRYKSTAVATITATAKNSSTISSKFINGVAPTDNVRTFTNCSETSFTFKATDSRGYTSSVTKSPTVISYVQLSINPILNRPTPTGSQITMSFSGDFYRGSFGAAENTLRVMYRYKESGGSYCAWKTIDSTKIVKKTKSYSSDGTLTLDDEFNYQKEYQFQVRALDGTESVTLSSVLKVVTVPRGIPVFDWGENDFNFNVPVSISGEKLSSFVVSDSLSGDWRARRWSDGTLECWCKYTFSTAIKNAWGVLYESDIGTPPDFPYTFAEVPQVFMTMGNGGYSAFIERGSESTWATKTNPGGICLVRPKAAETVTDYTVFIYAIGKYN